jgi:hypothetical protein
MIAQDDQPWDGHLHPSMLAMCEFLTLSDDKLKMMMPQNSPMMGKAL